MKPIETIGLGITLALAGCAGSVAPGVGPIPEAPTIPGYETTVGTTLDAGAFEEPSGLLTRRDARTLALLHNPDLAAFAYEIRAREAETLQAAARPNPTLAVDLENLAGSGSLSGLGGSETTLQISQTLELGGKRARRRDLARQDENLAVLEYQARRFDVFREVDRAFSAVLAAQGRVRIAEDLVEVETRFLETVSGRVRAGAVSPVEEIRAGVELASARLRSEQARRGLQTERSRLGALWGQPTPAFREASGSLEIPAELPGPLVDLEKNPDLILRSAEVDRTRADAALQRAIGTPDLTLAAGVRYLAEGEDRALVVGMEIPIPLADRNRQQSRAAGHRLDGALAARVAARVRAEAELHQTFEQLRNAFEEARALDREILPEARAALEAAEDAYRRGLFRVTDLLDIQRTLFELRTRRLDALVAYHESRAVIERLIGTTIEPTGETEK